MDLKEEVNFDKDVGNRAFQRRTSYLNHLFQVHKLENKGPRKWSMFLIPLGLLVPLTVAPLRSNFFTPHLH
ncbi:UNVERIFIED_CONTAM: hypothetical protein Sradi_2549600 [Sesamum radiatum]|uniref:Uncharacterized protein n=1 Tax=Sesamum radiatum TaxID=300843 RepID=A0AAW2SLF0_SESRA